MANVRDFGAAGDGLQDDTDALRHAIDAGDGVLELPRGDYLISRPLEIHLAQVGRFALHGSGGTARLLMTGPGPAVWLRGTHDRSADPASFQPTVWQDQRLPTVSNLEIVGRHPEADGVRLEGVMQPTLSQLLIRQVRHGIHVTGRARNLLIGQCHIYHNTGVGVFLERVNLHQAIVTGSHISYCRLGGLRIIDSEIRNLQITGNDIEYNNNRA
ncbi:MAG: glycosyl hydrolase family 28-related protein, partial [Planctomycetaceae bacterium]